MERSKGKNTRLVNMLKIENKLVEGSPESWGPQSLYCMSCLSLRFQPSLLMVWL